MAGIDPLSWLVAPTVLQVLRRALAWAAEQAAEAMAEEGTQAMARQLAARLRGDEAQTQFQVAWEQAVAVLRREERFHEVAALLLQNSSLILEEAAKVAAFGAQPDLDCVPRWSLGLTAEKRELAREALEFLFARLWSRPHLRGTEALQRPGRSGTSPGPGCRGSEKGGGEDKEADGSVNEGDGRRIGNGLTDRGSSSIR